MTQVAAPPVLAKEERWTYARYLRETAEGEYFAIIEGEKVVSPSPTVYHQFILGNIFALFRAWLRQNRKGKVGVAPLDVVLSEDDVVQPDIVFAFMEHADRWADKNFQGVPDLVIEVVSPGSTRTDRIKKRDLYARHGIPEYWIVSPGEHTVEVLTFKAGQYEVASLYEEGETVSSPLLPGFTCAVDEIFEV